MKQLNVFFYTKKDKSNQAGEAPIYGKIVYFDTVTTFSTGIFITPEEWEKTNQLTTLKILTEEQEKKRKKLDAFLNTVTSYEERLRILQQPISAKILKDFLFPKRAAPAKEKPKHTLLQVFSELIKEKEQLNNAGMRSDGTITKYKTVLTHLSNYISRKFNKKDIPLNELNYSFIQGFYPLLSLYGTKLLNSTYGSKPTTA